MNISTKPKDCPLYFEPGELTLIKGRNNPALAQEFQRMMSGKVMDAILRRHPDADAKRVDIIRLNSPESAPKHWGMMLEFLYRIKGESGSYRHVFHLMLNGDQSGRLYTQTWRSIAK